MKIEDAQEMMRQIYLERDRDRGISGTVLRTFQELAELSDAILKDYGESAISEEIADVFAWLCSVANLLKIDISKSFYTKYTDVCSKCKKSPCVCPP
jgi:NTP pyrophosphatase (non-canonical NTP hydrolase)